MAEPTFEELVGRVRAGHPDAAAGLVRRCEPAIRRVVRLRLGGGGRIDGLFDSMDVCRSVLGSFFLRVAAGQYILDTPAELLKLLTAMTRNKLAFQVRKQRAQKRGCNRDAQVGMDGHRLESAEATPSRHVEDRDLLGELVKRLTNEECELVERRTQGHDWNAIADHLAGSPEALRKSHARALDRAAKELGLEAV